MFNLEHYAISFDEISSYTKFLNVSQYNFSFLLRGHILILLGFKNTFILLSYNYK